MLQPKPLTCHSEQEIGADNASARSADIFRDWQIIQACLAHQATAWSELYQLVHDPLLAAIRSFLRDAASDPNLTEEIAARVWYALVRNDGALLGQFDVSRGCRLITFLAVLAKNEARQYFRSERRRRSREEKASRHELEYAPPEMELTDEEFLHLLTPTERDYLQNVLVASVDSNKAGDYSRQNSWQLSHRVREKLHRFLDNV